MSSLDSKLVHEAARGSSVWIYCRSEGGAFICKKAAAGMAEKPAGVGAWWGVDPS